MLPVKYLGNSKIKSEMLIEEFCHLYSLLRIMCGIITTTLPVEGIIRHRWQQLIPPPFVAVGKLVHYVSKLHWVWWFQTLPKNTVILSLI